MKTVVFAILSGSLIIYSCGRKSDDKPESISGSFGADADKTLLTEWVVDGDQNDILSIDNKGKLVRTVSAINENDEVVSTSVESVAVVGKEDFKILKSVVSNKTVKMKSKDQTISTGLQKLDGTYVVLNADEAKIFTTRKKDKHFALKRKASVSTASRN